MNDRERDGPRLCSMETKILGGFLLFWRKPPMPTSFGSYD